jgi:hypothetical protein
MLLAHHLDAGKKHDITVTQTFEKVSLEIFDNVNNKSTLDSGGNSVKNEFC